MCAEQPLAGTGRHTLSAMGDSGSDVRATPAIGRVAVGICAAINLALVGLIAIDALSSSATAVLSAMAPPKGPLGLLAWGLQASLILGGGFAVNSLTDPDPDYGKVLNLLKRNDLSGLGKAAPAMPLMGSAFLIYWLGALGVMLIAWQGHQPGSSIAAVSAALALVGAAAMDLWLILVALGIRRHPGTTGKQEPA